MLALLRSFLIFALCVVPQFARADDLVVLLTPRSTPFSSLDDSGRLSGFNVDIANAICRELGRTCSLKAMTFPEIIPEIAAGRAHIGIANFLRTPERERLVSFSVPYWRSTSSLIGPSGVVVDDLAALIKDMSVCAISGSAQMRFLQEHAGGRTEHLLEQASNQALLDALSAGACRVALLPTMQALPFLQSPAGAAFGFLAQPRMDNGLGGDVLIALTQGDGALKEGVDRAIARLIDSGEHERITRKYFPFSIL